MLGSVRAAVEKHDMPDTKLPDYGRYEEEVRAMILDFSGARARDSVYKGLATVVLSEVVAITPHVIIRVLVSVGTSAVVSTAAGGGAAAGGTVSGGALGVLAGPVGTAIGIVGGLVISMSLSMAMNESFMAIMRPEMERRLALQRGLSHEELAAAATEP
jgi:hypothetical protein